MNAIKTLLFFITLAVMATIGSNALAFDIPEKPDNGWYIDLTGQKALVGNTVPGAQTSQPAVPQSDTPQPTYYDQEADSRAISFLMWTFGIIIGGVLLYLWFTARQDNKARQKFYYVEPTKPSGNANPFGSSAKISHNDPYYPPPPPAPKHHTAVHSTPVVKHKPYSSPFSASSRPSSYSDEDDSSSSESSPSSSPDIGSGFGGGSSGGGGSTDGW